MKQDVELYSADWTLHFRPPSLEVLEMHHRNFYVYRGIGVRRNGRQRRKASEQRPKNAIVEKIGVGLCSIFDAMRQGALQQLPTKGDTLFVNSGNQLQAIAASESHCPGPISNATNSKSPAPQRANGTHSATTEVGNLTTTRTGVGLLWARLYVLAYGRNGT